MYTNHDWLCTNQLKAALSGQPVTLLPVIESCAIMEMKCKHCGLFRKTTKNADTDKQQTNNLWFKLKKHKIDKYEMSVTSQTFWVTQKLRSSGSVVSGLPVQGSQD